MGATEDKIMDNTANIKKNIILKYKRQIFDFSYEAFWGYGNLSLFKSWPWGL